MRKITWKKIKFKLGAFFSIYIESAPYKNWFNPLITFYINFRSFPLRQAIKFPLFAYGWPRIFSLYGDMECIGTCKTGMIKLNRTIDGAPSHTGTATEINNWGKILFHGPCKIHTANKINVYSTGTLNLGSDTMIMHHCNITAHKSVSIGDKSWITHRCQVIDSNFHFIADFEKGSVKKYSQPISIGNSCWICNSTTIAAGSTIPDFTIVASNSLVNRDMSNIPPESLIGGIPAKFLRSGLRRIYSKSFEKEIWKYFSEHPETNIFPLPNEINHDQCNC